MANPRLLVEIAASIGSFREEMGKAAAIAEANAGKIDTAIGGMQSRIKQGLAGIAAGVSVHAFTEMIRGALDAQEQLSNLGARAGLTGEQLSALVAPARLSQTSLEDVANMSARLSKALLEAQEPGSQAAQVLEAIGIKAKDLPALLEDPIAAMQRLAKGLDSLGETSGTKAAAQLLILGKAGGTTSAFLKELASTQQLVARSTNEEIEAAKRFNDRLTEQSLATEQLKKALAIDLLPTLNDVLTVLHKFSSETGGAKKGLDDLAQSGAIKQWAEQTVIALATVAESLVFVAKAARAVAGSFEVVFADTKLGQLGPHPALKPGTQSFGFPTEADLQNRERLIAEANKRYADLWNERVDILSDAVKKQFALSDAQRKAETDAVANADQNDRKKTQAAQAAKREADRLAKERERALVDIFKNKGANKGAIDDPAKQELAARLDELKASSAASKAVLRNDEQALEASFARGELDIAEFYAKKQKAQDDDLRITTENFVAEIAAIDAFIAQASTEVDKAFGRKLKVEAEARQRLAVIGAAGDAQRVLDEQTRATVEFRHAIESVNAELLEMEGHLADAARIRFGVQRERETDALKATIRSEFSTPEQKADAQATLDHIKRIGKLTEVQARLNEITRDYGLDLQQLDIVQRRIDIARQAGSITELDALAKQADAARSIIPILREKADALEREAQLLSGPTQRAALQAAQEMRLRIEELAVAADALGRKFADAFADPFQSAVEKIATGAGNIRDIFKQLAKDIEANLARIAAQNLREQLFGKGGPLGGVGDFFGKLFSSGGLFGPAKGAEGTVGEAGTAAAGASLAASGASLTASGVTLTASATALTASAAALTAAAASLSASSVASVAGGGGTTLAGLAEFFSYANGTTFHPGGMAIVGERGPELVNLPRGAQVIPNHVLAAKRDARGKAGPVVNQTINFINNGPVDTRTQTQISAQAYLGAIRGARNL